MTIKHSIGYRRRKMVYSVVVIAILTTITIATSLIIFDVFPKWYVYLIIAFIGVVISFFKKSHGRFQISKEDEKSVYGFKVGDEVIEIKATSKKEAYTYFTENYGQRQFEFLGIQRVTN